TLITSSLLGSDEDKLSKIKRSVEQTSEKSVFADISIAAGVMILASGTNNEIFDGEFSYLNNSPDVQYEIVGDEGRLSIEFDDFGKLDKDEDRSVKNLSSLDNFYENECRLNLSDKMPLSLNLDLGLVKGELSLGGLQLQEIKMSSGVSKAFVSFNEPNPILLKRFEIEAGVGDLELTELGNANIKYFKFEGGIGNYVLDFSGDLRQDSRVDIDVSLGKLKMLIPSSHGVRIQVEKSFLSSFSIDDVYIKDGNYYNANWEKSEINLDINIVSEVGKVSVVWLED
ncbi:MAG: hypothetical protein ACE5GL_05850, partial [Calditrichia bacterium]